MTSVVASTAYEETVTNGADLDELSGGENEDDSSEDGQHALARLTNKPQCVIVHVDVGTQGLSAAVHNASCGRVPDSDLCRTIAIHYRRGNAWKPDRDAYGMLR